jgi:hypothetical protein
MKLRYINRELNLQLLKEDVTTYLVTKNIKPCVFVFLMRCVFCKSLWNFKFIGINLIFNNAMCLFLKVGNGCFNTICVNSRKLERSLRFRRIVLRTQFISKKRHCVFVTKTTSLMLYSEMLFYSENDTRRIWVNTLGTKQRCFYVEVGGCPQ